MSLRARLVLLFAVLTLLPALPAAWVTHDLLQRTVDIALRDDIDQALEAGVRQTRAALQVQRDALDTLASRWAAAIEASGDARTVDPSFSDPSVRVEVVDGPVLVEGRLGERLESREPGAPPFVLRERVDAAGTALRLTAPVDPQWRADALRTSESLQMLRLLRAERSSIERAFLVPFVVIVALALAVAVAAAWWMARGFTRRVDRLVAATDRVAGGDWSARAGLEGDDELARLGRGFDSMVASLDAQSRRLVDLETMAGWREMARALAHEVKNPLTPIQLTVEEMRERYPGDDTEYRALLDECTRIVIEEVESLRSVVGRFRDFARPVELDRRAFDPNRLLRDIGALQRDLRVDFDLSDELPTMVGDEDRLRQILMNLASNAREAGATSLRLASDVRAEGVALVFEDDGPGIPEAERAHVFEPYRTGKAGGLGLGLALVKGIVLAHDGSIEVDEGTLGGARFTVVLPPVDASGAAARSSAAEVRASAAEVKASAPEVPTSRAEHPQRGDGTDDDDQEDPR